MSKIKCKVQKVNFSKDGFHFFSVSDVEVIEGDKDSLQFTKWGTLNMRGVLNKCEVGQTLEITIAYHSTDSYGAKYEVVEESMEISMETEEDLENFLKSINLTELQVDALKGVDNIIQHIVEGNIDALCSAKGIGEKTAQKIIDRFESSKDLVVFYQELAKAGFENKQHRFKIVRHYMAKIDKSYRANHSIEEDEEIPRAYIEKAMRKNIEKIKENPYVLTEIEGFGLDTVDSIALTYLNIPYNSTFRVKSFFKHLLDEEGQAGRSFQHFSVFGEELKKRVEKVKIGNITEIKNIEGDIYNYAMNSLEEEGVLILDKKRNRIGLSYYKNLEQDVCRELVRLATSKPLFLDLGDIDENIKFIEGTQGYTFTEEQKQGMKMMADNNISVLTGFGGTGKTSTLNGILNILKGYSIGQFCFAGKAAQRMTQSTGLPASTIHMHVAKYEQNPEENQYELYVVDESSMIHLELILDLLRTIPDGRKVIFLGDCGQLQAITTGNLLADLIKSGVIATTQLTKVQRQGEASGILSASANIRNQKPLCSRLASGNMILGEMKDFELFVQPTYEGFSRVVIDKFRRDLEMCKGNILDVQILSPRNKGGELCGDGLNTLIQNAYLDRLSSEYLIVGERKFHIGDKVMNTKNNYNAVLDNKEKTSVFNGNIGIIVAFERNDKGEINGLCIDFQEIGRVIYKKEDCSKLVLAYCISTHKSQGSEAKRVIYVLTDHSYTMLCKEQFYTAITRAKEYCTVIGQSNSIYNATMQSEGDRKLTYLADMLMERKDEFNRTLCIKDNQ